MLILYAGLISLVAKMVDATSKAVCAQIWVGEVLQNAFVVSVVPLLQAFQDVLMAICKWKLCREDE